MAGAQDGGVNAADGRRLKSRLKACGHEVRLRGLGQRRRSAKL
jgi:hypothetical protein